LSIGSQTFDGVTNVLFENNYVYGKSSAGTASTDANAINIKTDKDCGGLVQQVTYQNTCIRYAKHLLIVNANYGSCSGTSGTPQFQEHRRQRRQVRRIQSPAPMRPSPAIAPAISPSSTSRTSTSTSTPSRATSTPPTISTTSASPPRAPT
jgi:polygalacturonase